MTTQAREGLLNGWDVILVSDCDWAELPSRRQVFARMFAQSGNRVIYVEPMESLPLLFESLKSEKVGRFAQGITQAEHNLWVLSPPPAAPGDAESPLINRMNNNVLRARIETEAKSLGFRKPVLILTSPALHLLAGLLDAAVTVYDCSLQRAGMLEEMGAWAGGWERDLLASADLTVTVSSDLMQSKGGLARASALVPNGCDTELFGSALNGMETPDPLRELPRPILGCTGGIHGWMDAGLLAFLASRRPNWSFVLVGPKGATADIHTLMSEKNLHLLPRVPQSELPSYLAAFNVALIPYKAGESPVRPDPVKLYEYLAAGRPVVSTDLPSARSRQRLIRIAKDRRDMLKQCEAAIELDDTPKLRADRAQAARDFSWQRRFADLNTALIRVMSTNHK